MYVDLGPRIRYFPNKSKPYFKLVSCAHVESFNFGNGSRKRKAVRYARNVCMGSYTILSKYTSGAKAIRTVDGVVSNATMLIPQFI